MSETFDHKSGKPLDAGALAVGVGALGAVGIALNQVAQHKEMLGSAGSAAFGLIRANPKIAIGVALVAGTVYCIHRLTQEGTEWDLWGAKFKRK